MASASNTFKSSEDFRRKKELEEARKAGLAPAEVDEDGNVINPHIPQFMASAPWYLSQDKPGLKHQKDWRDKLADGEKWYDRGAKVFQATKWRKGACENCGAMSHKTKDCLERPRAKGAKFTNKNIAADEKVEDITLHGFDAKRDRYNGYDAADYAKVMDRYEQLEQVRREIKVKEAIEAANGAADADGEAAAAAGAAVDVDVDDDVKIDDAEDAAFGEVKKRVRTTAGGASGSVRNLRIREDTAKYLLNLDVNSAHYDPKSRSMREDPQPHKPLEEKAFAGDNFVRHSGDYAAWQALNLHALTASAKGQDIHMQALPSAAELLHKQFRQKKDLLQRKEVQSVVDKYGSAAARPSAEEEALLLGGSERYVEYDRLGRVVKGQEVKARSKYEEDVYLNNHTSVWGSWWQEGAWGYACCRQTVKNSYCTGAAGAAAADVAQAQMLQNIQAKVEQLQQQREQQQQQREQQQQQQQQQRGEVGKRAGWGAEAPEDLQLDEGKLKKALERREEELNRGSEELDERKRGFNSLRGEKFEVSEEDMEAYRLKRARADDPLAAGAGGGGGGTKGYEML